MLDLSNSEINNGFLTWSGDYIKKIKQPWTDGYLCSPIKMELLNQSDQTLQENNILTYFKLENIQNIKLFFTDYLKSNLAIQNQLQNMISSASNLNRYSLHQNRLKYVEVQQYKVK